LDELDVKEKEAIKVEIRQKEIPELTENDTKESGSAKMEETRWYYCVYFHALEFFAWLMLHGNL